ncbi:MAG TPA: hypothetical protein VFN23_10110 [Ktedonobacteraceae bacterium]|nr:hypothetical protein [Ktedonobacteraceae bacterium]
MLDHDELLPEEQANPAVIQELQTIYQLKPEEKALLARVHQRLSQNEFVFPSSESLHERGPAQPRGNIAVISPLIRPGRRIRRWNRPLSLLAVVLFVAVLVGSLVFAFSRNHSSSVESPPVKNIHLFLVPSEKGQVPLPGEWEITRSLITLRLDNFGIVKPDVRLAKINGQPGLKVDMPAIGDSQQQTIDILTEPGVLAFWGTGANSQLASGTEFNPAQYSRYNPGAQPLFTNRDIDPTVLSDSEEPSGIPDAYAITVKMKGPAIKRFQTYTTNHIGQFLTITLDNKVLVSAIIHSPIKGPFIVPANLTQQQANAIISILRFGPSPLSLKQQK